MAQNAWSFVDYACGHSTPVQRGGGDRKAPRPCPDCRANARDPYICPRCHDTKGSSKRFCGGERCRNEA